jgi:histone acetyltransferase (RNA polymerase elongator complex component)
MESTSPLGITSIIHTNSIVIKTPPKPTPQKYCIVCQKNVALGGYTAHSYTKKHNANLELMIHKN